MSGDTIGAFSLVKYVRFETSDGKLIDVPGKVAMIMKHVSNLIEETAPSEGMIIPVKEIHSNILSRIIKYCTVVNDEAEKKISRTELIKFEEKFLNVDTSTLFHVINAASILDIESLLDISCKVLAEEIRGKTTEQLREAFNIENDFTPEELEQVALDNGWANMR